MVERQYATPILVDRLDGDGSAHAIKRIPFQRSGSPDSAHDEQWLQRLIQRHPKTLPIQEIEPGFSSLIPICLELPTTAGFADNFFVTSNGDLVVVECKLWRNPEARREVVAQIIDYAQSMAKWTYEDLDNAVRRSDRLEGGKIDTSLFEICENHVDLDEADFADAISRNLRLGRMLLLIVGDGVREGAESLTDYLQMHAGFHFTLAIIEMPVFELPDRGFLVQPRILARTINIERGIVHLSDQGVSIQPPEENPARSTSQPTSISKERFFEELATVDSSLPSALQDFLDRAAEHGVEAHFLKTLHLKWRSADGRVFNLGAINEAGEFSTGSVNWTPDSFGLLPLAQEYQDNVGSLIGAQTRKTPNTNSWYLVSEGTNWPKFAPLLAKQDDWLDIIDDYTHKLTESLISHDDG